MDAAKSKNANDRMPLTMQAIAEMWGVSRLTVYHLVKTGRLARSVRAGAALPSQKDADSNSHRRKI